MCVSRKEKKWYESQLCTFSAAEFHFCINLTAHYTKPSLPLLVIFKSQIWGRTLEKWKAQTDNLHNSSRTFSEREEVKRKKPYGKNIKKSEAVWGEGGWRWFPGKWGHIWSSLLTNMLPGWGLFLGKTHRSHISLPLSPLLFEGFLGSVQAQDAGHLLQESITALSELGRLNCPTTNKV